jgi:hypothetical protein
MLIGRAMFRICPGIGPEVSDVAESDAMNAITNPDLKSVERAYTGDRQIAPAFFLFNPKTAKLIQARFPLV